MGEELRSVADVQAAAYRAYVQAMKDGMAKLDVEAIDIPTGGLADAAVMPSCHCVGTLWCMGHIGCVGGCVGCFGTVGSVGCYAKQEQTPSA